jgi:hypothetical protein
VVGVGLVVTADGGERADDLLVEDDNAMGLTQDGFEGGVRVDRCFVPVTASEERGDHVGLHRAGAEQRDVDDEIVPSRRLELLQQFALTGRLDLETADRVGGADQFEGRLVVGGDTAEVDLLVRGTRDLIQRMVHRREHPYTEDVELEVTQRLDVVLVGLDHAVPLERALHRHARGEVLPGEHDAAGMQSDVPRESVEPFGHPEELFELSGVDVAPHQFRQGVERATDAVRADVGEGLRDDADLGIGQGERLADLSHRGARAIGIDHRDAGGAVLAVPGEDHVVDVLAARGLDVDVDIGEFVPHRVEEALERQVMADRVHIGDTDEVGDQRTGRAPPAGTANAHRADVVNDTGDRQEVGGIAEPVDHPQLVIESISDRTRGLHPARLEAVVAALGQHLGGRASCRRREVGEVHLLEADVEGAALGDVQGCVSEMPT